MFDEPDDLRGDLDEVMRFVAAAVYDQHIRPAIAWWNAFDWMCEVVFSGNYKLRIAT